MSILDDWHAWQEPLDAPPSRALRLAGNALSGMATVGLIPAAALVLVSGMMFDAPGSESNAYVWMLVALFWAAPVVLILVRIKARKAARTGRWSTFWLTLALLFLFGACVGAVNALLNHFCEGNFRCDSRDAGPGA